jgi:hypothetical protein
MGAQFPRPHAAQAVGNTLWLTSSIPTAAPAARAVLSAQDAVARWFPPSLRATSLYLYPEGGGSKRDAFLKRIAELKPLDEEGAREIIADVIKEGLSDLIIETLIKPLAEALGVNIPVAKKFWKEAASSARGAANAEVAKLAAEAHARFKQEANEQQQRQTTDGRDQLWASCRHFAESPTLLADMEKFARRLGLVGEGASLRGAYLTASSRFNEDGAICLLRRGAPAGGKNFLVDRTFVLIPEGDIIRVSSGSPLSLVYYGGEDEDALKHKIIYVPEAAVIAEKNKAESPLTVMLRILISEGRLDHNVVVPQADGAHVTIHIKRNGPVVVIITSARDNVEDEMLTRLMTSDADESQAQTINVVMNALLTEDRNVSEAEIGQWLDFQRWLALEAPYKVVIPFRRAISEAFTEHWEMLKKRGENPKIQLRLRRDVHGMLAAIKTSAILHKAQRKKDARGRIIATVQDYKHANTELRHQLRHGDLAAVACRRAHLLDGLDNSQSGQGRLKLIQAGQALIESLVGSLSTLSAGGNTPDPTPAMISASMSLMTYRLCIREVSCVHIRRICRQV